MNFLCVVFAYTLVMAYDDNLTVIIIHRILTLMSKHYTHLPCEVPELTLCNFVTVMLNIQAELAHVMCSHAITTVEQRQATRLDTTLT